MNRESRGGTNVYLGRGGVKGKRKLLGRWTFFAELMTASAVLIIATDPLAGALLGAAVELAGYSSVFPREGEAPREALRRLRPCVVLVDCDSDDACGESFFGPAIMVGAKIGVFTSTRSRRALEPIPEEYGVRVFDLPMNFGDLKALLDSCAKNAGAGT